MFTTTEGQPLTEKLIAATTMQWQELHPQGPTPEQQQMDRLTAHFLLTPVGRFDQLFDQSLDQQLGGYLNKDDFKLAADENNYQYIANIGIALMKKRTPNIVYINKIFDLLFDFDQVFEKTTETRVKYNELHFGGHAILRHPDFQPLVEELNLWLRNYAKDNSFRERAIDIAQKQKESASRLHNKLRINLVWASGRIPT
jgi:hypothetical protein